MYVATACIRSHTLSNKKIRERSAWAQQAVLVEESLHVPIISFVHRPAPLFVLRVRICLPIQEQPDCRRLTNLLWKECIRGLYVPIRSVQPSRDYWELCCKVIRSYTFCATLSRLLGIVLQSYTFLYVPVQQSCDSCELCCKVIRSYTFLKSSYTFLQVILNMLSESYTFLYVPMPFRIRSCG